MTLDRRVLAEIAAAVERCLRRVAERLPAERALLRAGTDAADVVVLNLWQAVQSTLDVAVSVCVTRGLGTPSGYADAFRRLQTTGLLEAGLADRLAKAAGFRNLVAHRYGQLDMGRVFDAARDRPADLRALLAVAADLV